MTFCYDWYYNDKEDQCRVFTRGPYITLRSCDSNVRTRFEEYLGRWRDTKMHSPAHSKNKSNFYRKNTKGL